MQINKDFLSYYISLLMCVMTEIHSILKKESLGIRHGLVTLLEKKEDIDKMSEFLIASGATPCRSFKRPTENIYNSGLAIHTYSKYDKEDALMDFMESDFFLPMVITCGFVPDFLKNASNILVLERFDIDDFQARQVLEDINGFRTFVREYPPGIKRKIQNYKTSDEFLQHSQQNRLNLTFMATIDVFSDFYRCSHSESEWDKLKIQLKNSVHHCCNISEDYADGWDISDAIRSSAYTYIDEHPEISLGQIDEIEGALLEAVENNSAILYDAKYYYFPEKVLRAACSPLLGAISFLDVKAALDDQGVLCCNSTTTKNYTVKKLLTNAYGNIFRVRFLKLKKNFFATPDSPALEERRESNICLSEILTEKGAQ